jgi:hypothetical protein
MGKKIEIVPGTKWNYLTFIKEIEQHRSPTGQAFRTGMFKCNCGNIIKVVIISIRRGNTMSCGCYNKKLSTERLVKIVTKHNESSHNKTVEYTTWQSMKTRCYNPNNSRWDRYGGRGIIVCDRWLNSFENFLEDMGRRPEGKYSIDRIEVNGNYEPSNCRWATDKEQANNRTNKKNA